MQDFTNHSMAQLRELQAQVAEELKKRHFLGVSQAREQILHIARGAGISVKELMTGKAPKGPRTEPVAVKYRHPEDETKQWSGRGRQPGWVKEWIAAGKDMSDVTV